MKIRKQKFHFIFDFRASYNHQEFIMVHDVLILIPLSSMKRIGTSHNKSTYPSLIMVVASMPSMVMVVAMIGNMREHLFSCLDVMNGLDMTAKKNNVCNEHIAKCENIRFESQFLCASI